MLSGRLGILYCFCYIDVFENRKILDFSVMIFSEVFIDNVWNVGVVIDCWRFLFFVFIC